MEKRSEVSMTNPSTLEERVTMLERTIADLQRRLASEAPPENWLEKVAGSITDEEAFLEALEYGRAFRQSDRPTDPNNGQP
jgi:hypothetical protein